MANWARNISRSATDDVQKEALEDLFVFGYQCKVFRDDEKARYLEEGRHLIPWMGDSSLMIDRYDGRGHLFDISPYDADLNKGSYAKLSEGEEAVERVCEDERYLELHTDIMEQATYEEEELKRLNEGCADSYAAISFNYDNPASEDEEDPVVKTEEESTPAEVEEPYVAPPELKVPEGMHMPPSMKMNAIMEKTAEFIARQGAQMEIVIKTKQSNNPQFDFLGFTHYLNPFYKHLVKMIKSGKYKPIPQDVRKRMDEEQNDQKPEHYEEDIDSHNFLKSVQAKLPVGQIANTAYAKLVSRMSSATGRSSPDLSLLTRYPGSLRGPPITTTSYNSEPTTGYRHAPRPPGAPLFYESSSNPTTSLSTAKNHYASHSDTNYDIEGSYGRDTRVTQSEQEQEYESYGDNYNHSQYSTDSGYYNDQYASDSYNYAADSSQRYGSDGYSKQEGGSYSSSDSRSYSSSYQSSERNAYNQSYPPVTVANMPPPPGMEPVTLPSLLSSTQPPPPGTVSPEIGDAEVPTGEGDETSSKIIVPPPDMLPIIDKMAAYVAKNGPDFELVVQSKEDARFNFLYSWHPHYPYYNDKKMQFAIEEGHEVKQEDPNQTDGRQRNGVDSMSDSSQQMRGGAKAAVSFSIKTKPKENDRSQPSLKPARPLLNDSSEEEEGNTEMEDVTMEDVEPIEPAVVAPPDVPAPAIPKQVPEIVKQEKLEKPVVPPDDLEKKIAEEQLKNKLATAAREKLAQSSKEKQVQAERKRRAAMFISMLKGKQGSLGVTPASTGSESSAAASEPVHGPSPAPAIAETNPTQDIEDVKPSVVSISQSPPVPSAAAPTMATAASRPLPFIAVSSGHLLVERSKSPERRMKDKRRSRSRSPRRRRSRSPVVKRSRSRSVSRPRKHRRSRSKSKSRSSKSRKRSRSRSKSKQPKSHKSKDKRKSRSRSGSRSKSKPKKSKDKRRSRSRSRSKSKKTKDKKKDRSRSRSRSKSKIKESKSKSSEDKKRSHSKSESPVIEIKEEPIETQSNKGELFPIREEIIVEDGEVRDEDDSSDHSSDTAVRHPRPELLERVREMLKASRTGNQK